MNSKESVKFLLDIGAFALSIVALLVTIYFAIDTSRISLESAKVAANSAADARKHNELSTRPLLDFQSKLGIGPSEDDGGYIKIVNLGAGPAVITKINATFEGKPIETSAKELARIGGPFGFIASTLRVKQVIASGREVHIYRIKPSQIVDAEICPRDRARKAFAEKLHITVEYESLYQIKQSIDFDYTSPNLYQC